MFAKLFFKDRWLAGWMDKSIFMDGRVVER